MSASADIDVLVTPCQEHTQCPYESYVKAEILRRKVKRMTFQIGLFGKDGMILAGDTLSSESGRPKSNPQSIFADDDVNSGTVSWSTTVATKFAHDDKMQTVIAQCGDSISLTVAHDILAKWNGKQIDDIRQIGNDIYQGNFYKLSTQPTDLLIVRVIERRMLHFQVDGTVGIPKQHNSGKVITGRCPSLALLFFQKFIVPDEHSIEVLKPLAAYTVWLTGQLHPESVGGLEMIEFPDGKTARRLERLELQALETKAIDLHCEIKRLLLG